MIKLVRYVPQGLAPQIRVYISGLVTLRERGLVTLSGGRETYTDNLDGF